MLGHARASYQVICCYVKMLPAHTSMVLVLKQSVDATFAVARTTVAMLHVMSVTLTLKALAAPDAVAAKVQFLEFLKWLKAPGQPLNLIAGQIELGQVAVVCKAVDLINAVVGKVCFAQVAAGGPWPSRC